MKANERKLLMLLGVLVAAVVIVRVLPLAYGYYRQGREEIALAEERIERLQTLIQEQDQWSERETLKQAELADLQGWIFPGGNMPNRVASSIQRLLGQSAEQSGVVQREMRVAEYRYVGDWLMVSQEMSFTLEQHQILPFLNALQQLRPKLHVAAFNVARARRQFTGNITVVGFSRVEEAQ
jgi:hypothetical protein